ncbi:ferrochelatase [Coxiella burnetii]|uniref:Ferrochelatase n=1 Tax=Coxiella burnetii (strain Dugway 5J108-111) TaxID=434922 RepID=HEMH_COXBN|nr:RecName: Full=Ferrochelatase; AltName: Full=Heme synthase; AltName: Full=Protoheme ferro-lyase [Coxiella burnetii Dugway 5J108-111]ABS77267.2 ferrochelatase [Coxiella burnetii Dugway 5J108-111]OYK79522.1 ferrochelatase [Coxiella burnetii]OYK81603.1 ferrochelatase [Coxiella burnetii]
MAKQAIKRAKILAVKNNNKIGVLLINLGTPDEPSVPAVRRYLRQFLSDPKVIDVPSLMRWIIVHLCILPFRPKRSAKLYQKIWMPEGSPLLVYSEMLRERVGETLGDDFCVALGMRYGKPSIETALKKLQEAQCRQLIVLPLFPQYSTSTTASALEEVRAKNSFKEMTVIDRFFEEPHYIDSMTTLIHENLNEFQPDYFLFSYHGLPERHLVKSGCQLAICNRKNNCSPISSSNENCYRAQCFETSRLIAKKLNLTDQQYGVAFQSRLGRAKWIEPYTDKYLIELSKKGIKKLMVVCPSFPVDCLETLEEIGIRAQSQWQRLGGETLKLIPSLNAHPQWVNAIAKMAKKSLQLF